jgi:hypothetical protein
MPMPLSMYVSKIVEAGGVGSIEAQSKHHGAREDTTRKASNFHTTKENEIFENSKVVEDEKRSI